MKNLRQLALALFAFALGACGMTHPSVTIAPAGLVHVPASALPADAKSLRGGDALRIDFYSSPELLTEEGHILDDTYLCGDADPIQISNQTLAPFLGDASIRHPYTRQKLSAERANGANASVRPVYSTYVYVTRPAYPAANQIPARAAYDLVSAPRPICLSLNLREGYELARTTNTLTFSAALVAAALHGR